MKKSVSKKNPAAAADKVARAKELKRIRDAKYRAQKKAAKKPQQKSEACAACDMRIRVLVMTLVAQGLALRGIAANERIDKEARACALSAYNLGESAMKVITGGKHGKEVR